MECTCIHGAVGALQILMMIFENHKGTSLHLQLSTSTGLRKLFPVVNSTIIFKPEDMATHNGQTLGPASGLNYTKQGVSFIYRNGTRKSQTFLGS